MKEHWIILLACYVGCVQCVYDTTNANNIQTAITTSYNTQHRPSDSTEVKLTFGLFSINDLDIVQEQLSLTGFMEVLWDDPRLTWTAASHGGVAEIYMHSSSLWVPPLMLANTVGAVTVLHDVDEYTSLPFKVSDSGRVVWLAPADFVAQCTIFISYYPFDSQECEIMISSWFYSAAEVNIIHDTHASGIVMDLFEENGEWAIEKTSVENSARTMHGYPMPNVKFTLSLKRKYSYYLLNMILPIVFLAILGSFVFLLPTDSGEMIGFTLTILLSLSVMMTLVSDSIPPTSTTVSVLSVYLLTTFILCSIEVIVTVLILRIAGRRELGLKPSPTTQRFVNKFLAPLSRYRKPDTDEEMTQMKTPESETNHKSNRVTPRPDSQMGPVKKGFEADEDKVIEYDYKEIAQMVGLVCFPVFLIMTGVITTAFMIALHVGGQSSTTS